jgi:hypothetical protein
MDMGRDEAVESRRWLSMWSWVVEATEKVEAFDCLAVGEGGAGEGV